MVELVERGVRGGGAGGVAKVGIAPERCPGEEPGEALGQLELTSTGGVGTVRGPADRRVQPVTAPCQRAEELDGPRLPSRDVGGELLDQSERPLAAAVVDRIGDVE